MFLILCTQERAHSGFLNHYLSIRDTLLSSLDPILAPLDSETDTSSHNNLNNEVDRPTTIPPLEPKHHTQSLNNKRRHRRSSSSTSFIREPLYFHAAEAGVDVETGHTHGSNVTSRKRQILVTGHSLGVLSNIIQQNPNTKYFYDVDQHLGRYGHTGSSRSPNTLHWRM